MCRRQRWDDAAAVNCEWWTTAVQCGAGGIDRSQVGLAWLTTARGHNSAAARRRRQQRARSDRDRLSVNTLSPWQRRARGRSRRRYVRAAADASAPSRTPTEPATERGADTTPRANSFRRDAAGPQRVHVIRFTGTVGGRGRVWCRVTSPWRHDRTRDQAARRQRRRYVLIDGNANVRTRDAVADFSRARRAWRVSTVGLATDQYIGRQPANCSWRTPP